MKKFAFIGAGSLQFTTSCIRDLLNFPAFRDSEFCLMDINPYNLSRITEIVQTIIDKMGAKEAKVTSTDSRIEALTDADGVLCTVFNGDIDIWRHEIEIPKKYGVDINVGDTRSVSGIFRALRNIPLMLDICRDIETYAKKNVVFLNYTNPMSMLCGAMQKYSNVEVTGLCHSVQGTIREVSKWLNIPYEEITYKCLGVNHQAFYTEISHNGRDLYPELREKLKSSEFDRIEKVRREMFYKLGYFVTESSGHNSEYNAWFRKRPELIEKYCHNSDDWNGGDHAFSLNLRLGRREHPEKLYDEWYEKEFTTEKSDEYAANIFNARIGDGLPFVFNGNVLNHGSIPNLPYDACVEVPVVADRFGFKTTIAGPLPDHIAILVNTTARIESLVVEAAMKKSRELVYQAVYMDPLCSAVCSLEEIKNMCDEIFEKNVDYLGDYV